MIAGNVKINSYYTLVNGNAGWDGVKFHVTQAELGAKPFTFKMLFLLENILERT